MCQMRSRYSDGAYPGIAVGCSRMWPSESMKRRSVVVVIEVPLGLGRSEAAAVDGVEFLGARSRHDEHVDVADRLDVLTAVTARDRRQQPTLGPEVEGRLAVLGLPLEVEGAAPRPGG